MKQIFSNFSNLIALFIQNTKEQLGGQITSVPDLTSQTLIRTQLLFSRPDLKKPIFWRVRSSISVEVFGEISLEVFVLSNNDIHHSNRLVFNFLSTNDFSVLKEKLCSRHTQPVDLARSLATLCDFRL